MNTLQEDYLVRLIDRKYECRVYKNSCLEFRKNRFLDEEIYNLSQGCRDFEDSCNRDVVKRKCLMDYFLSI